MGWIPKLDAKRHFCHQCRKELSFEVKLQRADTCPHCAVDMHCCRNCEHWEASAHNQCKEQSAEYIREREAANFCTFFVFRAGAPQDDSRRIEDAKSKLEALFKK